MIGDGFGPGRSGFPGDGVPDPGRWMWRERRGRPDFGGPPWGRGVRMRRGDIRVLLLTALLDGPAHGYEIIRRLEARSGGTWRPSAGSVYPTLQLLEEEGMLTSETDGTSQGGGKRVYQLTDEGRQVAEGATDLPWDRPPGAAPSALAVREALSGVHAAARQVVAVGTPDQVERALGVLTEARQKLYQLLAEA